MALTLGRAAMTLGGLALALGLSACAPDRGRCLESHTVYHPSAVYPYTTFVPGPNGSVMPMAQYMYVPASDEVVCDRWEFPDGRPE